MAGPRSSLWARLLLVALLSASLPGITGESLKAVLARAHLPWHWPLSLSTTQEWRTWDPVPCTWGRHDQPLGRGQWGCGAPRELGQLSRDAKASKREESLWGQEECEATDLPSECPQGEVAGVAAQ